VADDSEEFPQAEFAPMDERPYTTLQEWEAYADLHGCDFLEKDLGGGGGMIGSPCGNQWNFLVTTDCQPSALCLQQIDKMKAFAPGTNRRKVVLELVEAAVACCERFKDYELSGFLESKDIECGYVDSFFDAEFKTKTPYWDDEWLKKSYGQINQGEKEANRQAENVAKQTGGPLWFPYGKAPSAKGVAWIYKVRRWFYLMSMAKLGAVIESHGGMADPDPAWWTPRIRALQSVPQSWLMRWAVCDPDKVQMIQSIMIVLQANVVAKLLEAGIVPPANIAQIPKAFVDWKDVETYRSEVEEFTVQAVQSHWQWNADAGDRDLGQAELWLEENCKVGAYDHTISKAFGRYLAICHPDGRTEIQQATLGEEGSAPELVVVDEGQVVEDEAPAPPEEKPGLPLALLWGGAGFLAAGPTGAALGAAAGFFYDTQKAQK
jgi:hypothetical protein